MTQKSSTPAALRDDRFGPQWIQSLDSSARAEAVAALLSRFNHDLRTPLNTILGWTHLLQKGGFDSQRANHVADVIGRNARDQTQMLEDFVDDGRTVLDVLEIQPTAVRIDELVSQAIDRAGPALTLHGVFLKSDLDAENVSVNGDARHLTRLIYRLLIVVTRRARDGSTIEVETDVHNRTYSLSVSGKALEPEWSDGASLELRISSLTAALHKGELHVGPDPTRPCIQLKLPSTDN